MGADYVITGTQPEREIISLASNTHECQTERAFHLGGQGDAGSLLAEMATRLADLMAMHDDKLEPCTSCANWFDSQRRVIRNAHGPLPNPEAEPDWTLLT